MYDLSDWLQTIGCSVKNDISVKCQEISKQIKSLLDDSNKPLPDQLKKEYGELKMQCDDIRSKLSNVNNPQNQTDADIKDLLACLKNIAHNCLEDISQGTLDGQQVVTDLENKPKIIKRNEAFQKIIQSALKSTEVLPKLIEGIESETLNSIQETIKQFKEIAFVYIKTQNRLEQLCKWCDRIKMKIEWIQTIHMPSEKGRKVFKNLS